MRKLTVVLLGLALAACGGGSGGGVTAPSGPTYPQVAGSYAGTFDIAFPELATAIRCPASTVVTQAGALVNIAPVVLTGECAGLSIPIGETTITVNGAFESGSGTVNEPSCGIYNYQASGGFFGPELRFSMNMTSTTCWNMNITAVLSR